MVSDGSAVSVPTDADAQDCAPFVLRAAWEAHRGSHVTYGSGHTQSQEKLQHQTAHGARAEEVAPVQLCHALSLPTG